MLEQDSDAAARGGVTDDLFGRVVEVVDPQAAAGEVARGVREHACGSTPVRQEDVAAVHAAHTIEGSISRG